MEHENDDEQKPPVFKRWRGWYFFILLVLFVQIVLFMLITNKYL
jgi:hypothetical protein